MALSAPPKSPIRQMFEAPIGVRVTRDQPSKQGDYDMSSKLRDHDELHKGLLRAPPIRWAPINAWGCVLVLVLAACLFAAPVTASRASGSESAKRERIVTWKTHSRYVDPSTVQFGNPSSESCGCKPHTGEDLPVNVFLPKGYDGKRRFPVLYLLHGADASYDTWLSESWDLPRIAKRFPGIIVMPDGGFLGFYSNWWNDGRRGDPGWERYHLDELTRLVERRLQVRKGRRYHAVAGWSMGGFGAAFYASQRPGYFGLAAVLSGPVSPRRSDFASLARAQLGQALGDPEDHGFYWEGHDPTTLASNLRWTRLYVRSGDGVPTAPGEEPGFFADMEALFKTQAEEFAAAAEQAGGRVRLTAGHGTHSQDTYRKSMPRALKWLRRSFGRPLKERPRRWSYRTVAKISNAFGLRFRFRDAPEELITFKLHGRRLSAEGSGVVRVREPGGRSFTAQLPFDGRKVR